MSEHVLLIEAGAAVQSAPLEVVLQLRLSADHPAGEEPDGAPHAAAPHLLHLSSGKRVSTPPPLECPGRHGFELRYDSVDSASAGGCTVTCFFGKA